MKKIAISLVVLLVVMLGLFAVYSNLKPKSFSSSETGEYIVDASDILNGVSLVSNIPKSTLSDSEITGLLQMREEEKLARDVYITLGQKGTLPVFINISQSEQTHTDAVKVLLDRYGISDPVSDNTVGVFKSQTFQKLYDDLVTKGKKSLIDALVVGATVEDLDIFDLEKLMKQTNKQDILVTYSNLQRGSRNHMRAFVKNISSNGGTYSPQYITKEVFASILSSPQERGR